MHARKKTEPSVITNDTLTSATINKPQTFLTRSWGAQWGGDYLGATLIDSGEAVKALIEILSQRKLHAVYQPIIDLKNAEIYGFEGLIRGPKNSLLHSPLNLFDTARAANYLAETEHLSRQVVLERYAEIGQIKKLFLNITPEMLLHAAPNKTETLVYLANIGLTPKQIIIEVTEQTRDLDYVQLKDAVQLYRDIGFEIALDDLGEGFSSLRLWSELQPDYVKVDKHFIHNIHEDSVKFEFVRSIQQIAQNSGAKVIAEGIEIEEELSVVKDLKIDFAQGYFLGKPDVDLVLALHEKAKKILSHRALHLHQHSYISLDNRANAGKLLNYILPISPDATNFEVMQLLDDDPSLQVVPIVDGDKPIGVVTRFTMIDNLARPYRRELFGKKPCAQTFMDAHPLIVDKSLSIKALSDMMTEMEAHHLTNGFIITDNGRYLGMGRGQDLLREITQMQITAARYANPITMLPGNVPISEQLTRLLDAACKFVVCYFDLDAFKPYNDTYGFRRGDDIISYIAKILVQHVDKQFDFVGHIGGDDFIAIFQSSDWQARCQAILDKVKEDIPQFYDEVHRQTGGIYTEDRQGNPVNYPYISLSIGAVKVKPGVYASQQALSSAVSDAKKQAKKMQGNSLFIERRTSKNS